MTREDPRRKLLEDLDSVAAILADGYRRYRGTRRKDNPPSKRTRVALTPSFDAIAAGYFPNHALCHTAGTLGYLHTGDLRAVQDFLVATPTRA
jgi:hypothetical protein